MALACSVIVNPAAANGRLARTWPRLVMRLALAGFKPKVLMTTGPGAATGLTRQALSEGEETIIAVGGDGTVNEVVNGLFVGEGAGREVGRLVNPNARLGVISCGTGADYVKSLGLPRGSGAIRHLARGRAVGLDVGVVSFRDLDGKPAARYFVNIADLGLGGETARLANRTTKVLGGWASFLWAATRSIFTYEAKDVEILADGAEVMREKVGMVAVANGRYFGGGMHAAPEASLTDGYLDVLALRAVPKSRMLFDLLPRVYRGAHLGHPDVWSGRAKQVVVRCAGELLLEMDGELVGMAEAEFRVLPGALNVLAPAGFEAGL